jgi:hypothetical protein
VTEGEADETPGGGDNDQPPPDEPPPPKIIKVEDLLRAGEIFSFRDIESPYAELDADVLEEPDAVAVARLDAEYITARDGEGVLVGEAIADLTHVIDELSGSYGSLRVRRLEFTQSMDVFFATAGEVEESLVGPTSKERRAAERLRQILGSADPQDLLERVGGSASDSLASGLEELLKLLVESRATLDLQTPGERPTRVVPEQALALYGALRTASELPSERVTRICQLVGAIADTRDFKVRLAEPWRGRRVLEGKFVPDLGSAVEQFFNRHVLARILVEGERRGIREPQWKFTLESLQAAPGWEHPRLPLGD